MVVDRTHPRYAHEAAITVHVNHLALEGRTANMSRGGLCADLEDAIAVGADVEVDIQLIFDEGTQSEPLRLPARVVWCTKLDDAFQIGLAFKPMTQELGEYLTMFLRYLGDGSTAQRRRRESSIDKRFE